MFLMTQIGDLRSAINAGARRSRRSRVLGQRPARCGLRLETLEDRSVPSTYNAATDFSATDNPNGVWSYGWSPTLAGAFVTDTARSNYAGIDGWRGDQAGDGSPSVSYNGTDAPVTPGSMTWQPGQLGVHPGPNGEYAVVRWTAPRTGLVSLGAAFSGLDFVGPTTTDVHVLHNGAALFGGEVRQFGVGPSFVGMQTVRAGDTIEFAVGYGRNNTFLCDTTGLDATVSYTLFTANLNVADGLLQIEGTYGADQIYVRHSGDTVSIDGVQIHVTNGTTKTTEASVPRSLISQIQVLAKTGNDVIIVDDAVANNPVRQTIYGGGGNDRIEVGRTNDYAYGGAGNDTLRGGAGSDTLLGDHGGTFAQFPSSLALQFANDHQNTLGLNEKWLSKKYVPGEEFEWAYITPAGKLHTVRGDVVTVETVGQAFYKDVRKLEVERGLYPYDLHFGWGGQDEKWLRAGDGKWHYLTPAGKLYRWEGSGDPVIGSAPLQGAWVRQGLWAYYTDPFALTVEGNLGPDRDRIYGGDNVDFLLGGADNDWVQGDNDKDYISGNAGNDVLWGLHGNDVVSGDDGNDSLYGGVGNDTVLGERGNDYLWGDLGYDTMHGGEGNDFLRGGDDPDSLSGEDGNDRVFGDGGNDALDGGLGDDELEGGSENDNIVGGAGRDTSRGGSGNDTLWGAAWQNDYSYQDSSNYLYGDDGNDELQGGNSSDYLSGGNGHDWLFGRHGNDTVSGGNDNDTLDAGPGSDLLSGSGGDDNLQGGDDNDIMSGNAGNDFLTGAYWGNPNETGNPNDIIRGHGGNDTLFGGIGEDYLSGGTGDDRLEGEAGRDTMHGSTGFDTQFADRGDETLSGGDNVSIWVPDGDSAAGTNFCGPNGASRLLRSYQHWSATYPDVRLRTQLVQDTNLVHDFYALQSLLELGTVPLHMVNVMRQWRPETRLQLMAPANLDLIERLLSEGRPVIALINAAGTLQANGRIGDDGYTINVLGVVPKMLHYIVLTGFNKATRTFTFMDYDGRSKPMSYTEFMARWDYRTKGPIGAALTGTLLCKERTIIW